MRHVAAPSKLLPAGRMSSIALEPGEVVTQRVDQTGFDRVRDDRVADRRDLLDVRRAALVTSRAVTLATTAI